MNKKVAYLSGTRADFGLMTEVLKSISESKVLQLNMYATGMHLMSQFGKTLSEVKRIHPLTQTIPAIVSKDDRTGNASFFSSLVKRLTIEFKKNRPDIALVLGDRPEMLAVAISCLYLEIPVAHIHGGEKTSTIDEIARHAITKLSHIHFAATKKSAERIKLLGEEAWRVHVVGAPGLDAIRNKKIALKNDVYSFINIPAYSDFFLVTIHPISELHNESRKQIRTVLDAVSRFKIPVVIIYPNSDTGGRIMIKEINKYEKNSFFRIFPNIPYHIFLGLEKQATVWIGNSSAGMIESSSFKTPVVNVGPRQNGRERGINVIDVPYNKSKIESAIKKSLFDKNYLNKIKKSKNPWGNGNASQKILKILEKTCVDGKLLYKKITYE